MVGAAESAPEGGLQPEQLVRLAQHDGRQAEERADQDEEDDPEAQARSLRLASPLDPRATAEALVAVAARDRGRIDGRLVGGADAAGGLGHRESLGVNGPSFHRRKRPVQTQAPY